MTLGLYVNQTPKPENDGIALSRFNVTSPGSVPVVIQITPTDSDTLRAFIRFDKTPTTSEFDYMLMSWDGGDNYTLFIAADLTTDVSHIYVGVQSDDG